MTQTFRSLNEADQIFGLPGWGRLAAEDGYLTDARGEAWEGSVRRADRDGKLAYESQYVIACGVAPFPETDFAAVPVAKEASE